jgi:transposase
VEPVSESTSQEMIRQLQKQLASSESELASTRSELTCTRDELASVKEKAAELQHKLDALLQQMFGRKSERYRSDLPLFDGLDEPEPAPPPPFADEVPDDEGDDANRVRSKKPRRRGAARLPKDIKRVIEDVEPTHEEATCSCCGQQRKVIGYEETEKLEYEPASCFVRVIRRPKLACPDHEEAGVTTPDLPPQAIDKGLAGESMLAQVVASKFADHLPLYRQSRIYQRQGICIAESTLCDWIRSAHELLQPIVKAVHRSILASGYVASDDTGVTLLLSSAPKRSKRANLWAYVGAERGDVVYDFTEGRSSEGPKRMLAGLSGFHQGDAYSAYDTIYESGDVDEVGCNAHARRKFFDAKDHSPEIAHSALMAFKSLYAIERRLKAEEATHAERQAARQAEAIPVFDALRDWLATIKSQSLPKSPIGKAVRYFLNHADALRRYVDHGRLEIDNNRCERAMRQVAVGRKNWLFAGSAAGGQRAATLYSLTVGCWELGIDPFAYLRDVLRRVNTTAASDVDQLTPRGWLASKS